MYFPTLFTRPVNHPVRACLMGAGESGIAFLCQAQNTPHLTVPAVCAHTVQNAVDALIHAGADPEMIKTCETPEEARKAYSDGFLVVSSRFEVIADLPMDVLVESSGDAEASAAAAEMAITRGMHVIMMSREADSVVGPILAYKAMERGRVYTSPDGEQASALIGLVSWAQSMGLHIVAAGKACSNELVYDPGTGSVTCTEQDLAVSGMEAWWDMPKGKVQEVLEGRWDKLPALKLRTEADLCAMQLVANATGLLHDTPRCHAPVARIRELPDIFAPREEGGLLEDASGRLDIFTSMRRKDEPGMGGSIFIVVECDNAKTWDMLAARGHVRSYSGKYALIYRPAPMMGVETVVSVLAAAILNHATGGDNLTARCDLYGKAAYSLSAGTSLAPSREGHGIEGLEACLSPAGCLAPSSPLPFYLLRGLRLVRDVPAGKFVCLADVDVPKHSTLLRMRREQDELTFR